MSLRVRAAFFTTTTFAILLAGCGIDIGTGSQFAGQHCFQGSDCAEGLRCQERICVPVVSGGGSTLDVGFDGDTDNESDVALVDMNPVDMNPVDMPPPVDMSGPCMLGARTCISEAAYRICVAAGDATMFEEVICALDTQCVNGDCVPAGSCVDNDEDGFGVNCAMGPDCDDANPRTFPGRREGCATPYDDNCNGEINEGCSTDACCPGGCGSDQFCDASCTCRVFDPQLCAYQGQPCSQEGAFDNGFACFSFDGVAQPRCWGICQINADDPDATCPEAGSVCAFDAGDGQNGICMSVCEKDAPTGIDNCGSGLGCLSYDLGVGDGICTPSNPANGPNALCDSNNFFDCTDGFVCIDVGNQGRCREACRPFVWGGTATDCNVGHCAAFSSALGVCFRDTNASEGQPCQQQNFMCGEDAVGCYPTGGFDDQCTRLCRLAEGDADCVPGWACAQFDMNQTEIGACLELP